MSASVSLRRSRAGARGIVTHPRLWRILETLGLDPHNDFGIAVQRRVTLGADGAEIGAIDCAQVMTSWDRLFRMLPRCLAGRSV